MNQLELREQLSNNIKKRRKIYSLTQEKLAEETGLSAQTINDIEGCRTWVSDKTLIKIAEVLHTSPAELLIQDNREQLAALDFVKFKTELKDSVMKTIDDKFREYKIV
jgi:transcriptional regulator with XRE-family HTH domain